MMRTFMLVQWEDESLDMIRFDDSQSGCLLEVELIVTDLMLLLSIMYLYNILLCPSALEDHASSP
jgi:hypothetical protein